MSPRIVTDSSPSNVSLSGPLRVLQVEAERGAHVRDSQPSEKASVIAARQLAEEAHRRRMLADLRRRRRPMAVPPPLLKPPDEPEPETDPEWEPGPWS
jgi:hypothetical protein